MKKDIINKKKKKIISLKKKQHGGNDVVSATINLIDSMVDLGKSIFGEIKSLTNISSDINNGAAPSPGTPGQIQGPPNFDEPKLK
jgi:hypothetical protein